MSRPERHWAPAEFCGRVAEGSLEHVALDALLAAEDLIKAAGKHRTDSTHLVAAVAAAALNRLELTPTHLAEMRNASASRSWRAHRARPGQHQELPGSIRVRCRSVAERTLAAVAP